jgi:hypothetical protein
VAKKILNGKVVTSITSVIDNTSNMNVCTLFNRDEEYKTNANAYRQLAKRRDAHVEANYVPPHTCGAGDGENDVYPSEVTACASDNPEAEDSYLATYFPEVNEGLQHYLLRGYFQTPGSFFKETVTVDTIVPASPECLELTAAATALRRHTHLSIDMEWNTSKITGTGTESPVMTCQITSLAAHGREVGTNAGKVQQYRAASGSCDIEGIRQVVANATTDAAANGDAVASYLTPDLEMARRSMPAQAGEPATRLTSPGHSFMFRLADTSASLSSSSVVPTLPAALVDLLNDPEITWIGSNLKGDRTRLRKT